MPEKYLITYRAPEGEFFSELMTMKSIADFIGFRDVNECSEFRVYRILPGNVYPLQIRDSMCFPLVVSLYDRFDNLIDSAEYDDH